jgi:hypothetical protein
MDMHSGTAPLALRDVHVVTDDDDTGRDGSWAETVVTVLATVTTIGIVSFVAVLMALA